MSDTALDRIMTMENVQQRIVGYFENLKDKIPEAGTMAAAVELFGSSWAEVKNEMEELQSSREKDLGALGDLETKNDEAVETIKNLEDTILVLEGKVKKLSFIVEEGTTTVEKLNDRGTFIGRRSSGDMETITIPGDLDIFNPTGVEWDEEFGETLAVFESGFKVGLDFLRKIQELHQDAHRKHLTVEEMAAYRKEMEAKFVEVLKKQGVTWPDVPQWLELMFGIQTTSAAVKMKFHRSKKVPEETHEA